mmetsp:Transcript_6228/g.15136  ORF Transcript_6228/g.15136 Transcript_6228/m.15136 type:complete len:115 (+) Transcript_6228:1081-1425(+)
MLVSNAIVVFAVTVTIMIATINNPGVRGSHTISTQNFKLLISSSSFKSKKNVEPKQILNGSKRNVPGTQTQPWTRTTPIPTSRISTRLPRPSNAQSMVLKKDLEPPSVLGGGTS